MYRIRIFNGEVDVKNALLSFGGLIGLLVIFSFYHHHSSSQLKLKICAWSNYFSDDLIRKFEKEMGIPVELSLISSNEELLAKIRAGAGDFDVVQPTDYMVRQMVVLNLLAPLDHSKLPHLSSIEERFTNLPYDPGLHVIKRNPSSCSVFCALEGRSAWKGTNSAQ